ncbi:hypothetical protein [Tenacibaculum phage PTm5]|uniref:Uncharacterized protein n=1 Tax=Tenacibaculum phage PTm5 TaxID=2547426 RepID=A0A5S9BZJ2_9CAUD|nr:hypothetical protein [Tenacibaculum phage PTm5]
MKGIFKTCKVELKINDNKWSIAVTPIYTLDDLKKLYTTEKHNVFYAMYDVINHYIIGLVDINDEIIDNNYFRKTAIEYFNTVSDYILNDDGTVTNKIKSNQDKNDVSKSPFVYNRLVCGIHFATRFKSLVSNLSPADACMDDELEAMNNYADTLLRHQVLTATDKNEIEYLKRCGVYDKYNEPLLTTHDGYKLYSTNSVDTLYSCLKSQAFNGDQVLQYKPQYVLDNPKSNRLYFVEKDKCVEYMKLNKPTITLSELKELGLYDEYINKSMSK